MQENIVNSPDLTAIAVEGYVVRIHRPVALEAPRAADLLRSLPPNEWLGTVEDMVEYGATALLSVKTSATVQLLEQQMADLVEQLRTAMVENLGKTMQTDRELAKETLMRLLNEHSGSMNKLLGRYVDPNSKTGLPAVMAQQLEQVTKSAVRQVDALLQDGDESALGKLAAKLSKQIEAVEVSVCEKLAARNALMTRSMHKGRPFEEAITAELAELVRPYGGQVERVGDTLGVKRQRHGDHVIIFAGPLVGGHTVKLAIEAKTAGTKAYSYAAVKSECQSARENREAAGCIFIGETVEVLPDGRNFGPVSQNDYFVAWSPDGQDELLGITLYLAMANAVHAAMSGTGSEVDRSAMRKEIDGIRSLLQELSSVESCHSSAVKSIEKARLSVSSVRASILTSLSKLDNLVAG
jgi:hypothetical protein